ncbi:site-specific integrase [Diaphorobacter sp. HDW4B]|uniref:tyrosine-type recombinase/integrase n=1 Tax=Diaphorobacter sp. HDW4B TaxID=2714925 RepID=UPI0014075A8D|nr:site-specific integrase [Diaphorobacter sp. HDW4B]QIL73286.1 site-specific integrase [Diaphorobacter sp. HDW4B]
MLELWELYRKTPKWAKLAARTKSDYEEYSIKLLEVMGAVPASVIRPTDIARYLRVERANAPVRGNREIALLSNLMSVAIERGDIDANPCKQVKRNSERARTEAPDPADLRALLTWLESGTPARRILALMAEFAALAGSRRIEFLDIQIPQLDVGNGVIRLMRAKQHGGSKRQETISMGPAMRDLAERMLRLPRPDTSLHVFVNQKGNPVKEAGFTTGWQRAMTEALDLNIISRRFTFHDLRAYYTTQHKERYGALPELHADATTTARVYDRSKVAKRRSLG